MTYFQISKLTTSRAVVLVLPDCQFLFAHLGKSLIPSINYWTRITASRLLTMVVNPPKLALEVNLGFFVVKLVQL